MNGFALLALNFFLERAAAGFPLIRKWFPAIKSDVSKASKSPEGVAGPSAMFAAPAEIKTFIVDQLKKARDGATVKMKLVYTFLIALADNLTDTLWDSIFKETQSADPASVTFGKADDTADYSVTALDETQLKVVTDSPLPVVGAMS